MVMRSCGALLNAVITCLNVAAARRRADLMTRVENGKVSKIAFDAQEFHLRLHARLG